MSLPIEVVSLLHANAVSFFLARERRLGKQLQATPEVTWVVPGDTAPTILGFTAPAPDPATITRLALASYRRRLSAPGADLLLVAFEPDDRTPRWAAAGCVPVERESGMAMALDNLAPDAPTPDGLHLLKVTDDEGLALMAMVVAAGRDERAAAYFTRAFPQEALGEPQLHAFLMLAGERPVATSMLWLDGGVASVWWVTTIPGWRGRGIGSLMTLHAFATARRLGYRWGTLLAMEGARRMYEQLGFQHCCHFTVYRYVAADLPP